MGRVDKLDSSFSRSRSSSMSSLENITSEAIQCLAFADTYAKRNGEYLRLMFYNILINSWILLCFDRSQLSFTHTVGWYQSGFSTNRADITSRPR